MLLCPDVWSLVNSFLPPKRYIGQHMCVAAFGRLQDDRSFGYEFNLDTMFREMRTHTSILFNCRRFGAHFGSCPTPRTLQLRMRLVEELYLCLELEDEHTRLLFAPRTPVFSFERVSMGRWGRGCATFKMSQLFLRKYIRNMLGGRPFVAERTVREPNESITSV